MIIDKAKLNEYADLNLGRVMNYSEMIEPFSKYIESISDSKVFTGIPTIDEKLFGFRPPEVISILSEPDIGKTTFIMNFLKYQIDSSSFLKNKLLINFSLELNEYDLIERVLQMGNLEEWRNMVNYYSREQILATIEWSAQLDKRDKDFSKFFLNSGFLHAA